MNHLELKESKLILYNDELDKSVFKNLGAKQGKEPNSYIFPPINASLQNLWRTLDSVWFESSVDTLVDSPCGFQVKHIFLENADWYYPYQREAYHFLANNPNRGCMLSLSPGLGKTATAIGAANALNLANILVVCPLSLIPNWFNEIEKWYTGINKTCWSVTNYEKLLSPAYDYTGKWDLVIFDESILLKNRKTKRFKKALEISKKSARVWLLSGAPISRYADDLWSQLHIMNPDYFTSYWRFANTYCHVTDTPWGSQITGTKNIDFRSEFKDLIFTRTHQEVLPSLPKPIYESISVDLLPTQQRMYNELRDDFVTMLSGPVELPVNTRVAQLIRLQQVVSGTKNLDSVINESAKLDVLLEMLNNESIQLPAIVWVHWREGAKAIYERLSITDKKVALVLGGSDSKQKISDYKSGKYDILIMSLGVGKFGHTLINTKTMIYYDRIFDSDAMNQSIARVDGRIGLQHRPLILTLKARNTIDDLLDTNLSNKMRSLAKLTNRDLSDLIQGMFK